MRNWLIFNDIFPNSSKTKILNITLIINPFICRTICFDSIAIFPSDELNILE